MKRFQPGLKREARLQRHGGGRSRLRTGNKEGKEQQIVGVGEEADLDLQRLQQTPAAHLWLGVCVWGGGALKEPQRKTENRMQSKFVSNQIQQERPGSWGPKKVEEEVRRLWGRGRFPGGGVGKNLLASARDIGLIPGPGRFHVPQNS